MKSKIVHCSLIRVALTLTLTCNLKTVHFKCVKKYMPVQKILVVAYLFSTNFYFIQYAFQVNVPQSKQAHLFPWPGKVGLNKKQNYLCRCCNHLRRVMKRRFKERTEEESLVNVVILITDYQGVNLMV